MGGIIYKAGLLGHASSLGPIGDQAVLHGRYMLPLGCISPDQTEATYNPCMPCKIPIKPPPPPPPPPPNATYATIDIGIWEMVTDNMPPPGNTSPYWISYLGHWTWSENLLTGETWQSGPMPTGPWPLYQGNQPQGGSHVISPGYLLVQTGASYGPPGTSVTVPDQIANQIYNSATGQVDSAATQAAQSAAVNSALAAAHTALGIP